MWVTFVGAAAVAWTVDPSGTRPTRASAQHADEES